MGPVGRGALRLNSENVAETPRLVAVLLVGLAQRVDVVDADDPFVLRELDVAAEVVHVPDERRQDLAVAGLCLRAHEVDDVLREVGVEAALAGAVAVAIGPVGSVGGHLGVVSACVLSGAGNCKSKSPGWKGRPAHFILPRIAVWAPVEVLLTRWQRNRQ